MVSKDTIAADHLTRIREARMKVANSEAAIIPAALRMGFTAERVAYLTGAPIERVRELEGGIKNGT